MLKGPTNPLSKAAASRLLNGPTNPLSKSTNQLNTDDTSTLSGLFGPSILNTVSDLFDSRDKTGTNTSRSSTESSSGHSSSGQDTSSSSPSASSNSNAGQGSSCGTSPEPYSQSPIITKPLDSGLPTIGEERANDAPNEMLNMDYNSIDWFAHDNGTNFDPVLFGDYRDPQENLFSTGTLDDSFFSDAFRIPDFNSPLNAAQSPAPKIDLIKQIDDKQNEDDEVVPADTSKMLTCSNIWDQIQSCPQIREDVGFDLNDLCSKLQKQAKCSESGAVVDEKDFKAIMQQYAKTDRSKTFSEFTEGKLTFVDAPSTS